MLLARRWVPVAAILLAVVIGTAAYAWVHKRVVVTVDGEPVVVSTYTATVGEVLQEQGITWGADDVVRPQPETRLSDGLGIHVVHAFPVKLVTGEKVREIITLPTSVQGVLVRAGVAVGARDQVIPGLDSPVRPGSEIKITRVSVQQQVVEEEIPFKVRREEDAGLDRGVQVVKQAGEVGRKRQIIEITYEDGREVARRVVTEEVIKEPRDKVVALGTRQVVSRGGQDIRFREALVVTATAYSPTGNRTATGVIPEKGVIAVDPRVIPLGTRVYVESYGYGRALDVGSAIQGRRIDVFFPSAEEARRWGVRQVKLYILE